MRGTHDEMNVVVRRLEVLVALRENRAEHKEIYDEAVEGFKKKAKEKLQAKLDALESGKYVDVNVSLRKPQHYLKTFDRIIRMLEMSIDDEITLTEGQFSAYVMNDWDWMGNWALLNSAYSAKAATYAVMD